MEESRPGAGAHLPESPVPEAMGRLLAALVKRIGVEVMDRVWVFPPLVRGRREWGLVAVSCLTEDPARRDLVTGRYTAEMTGKGVLFEAEFMSEGSAPPDRLSLVMDGVVRRSDLQLGVPREKEIGGSLDTYNDLRSEYGLEDWPADPAV